MTQLPPAEQDRQLVLLPALGMLTPYIPRVGRLHPAEERPRECWEAWGFTLRDPTPEQEQIGAVPVLLPPGWSLRHTDPDPVATVADKQNRGRAYLAIPSHEAPQSCIIAWARFNVLPHFAPTVDIPEPREGEERYAQWCYTVIDHFFPDLRSDGSQGRLVFSSSAFEASDPNEQRSGHMRARHSCIQWLDESWPAWQNPFAYWVAEEKPER